MAAPAKRNRPEGTKSGIQPPMALSTAPPSPSALFLRIRSYAKNLHSVTEQLIADYEELESQMYTMLLEDGRGAVYAPKDLHDRISGGGQ